MRFVNTSKYTINTSFSGRLYPGECSENCGEKRKRLETVMREIVEICGLNMAIKLDDGERNLLDQIVELNRRGSSFDKNKDLPAELVADPDGSKRGEAMRLAAQQKALDGQVARNKANAHREALINGEISELHHDSQEGEKFDPSMLKTGFEKILEVNAKIAAGKKQTDPVAEMKAATANGAEENAVASSSDASGVESVPQNVEGATAMDQTAMEFADSVSSFGPSKKRGRKNK